MTSQTSEATLTRAQVSDSLELFEFKPGMKAGKGVLRELLPDSETALFFAKAYELDYTRLADLLLMLFPGSDVIQTLVGEASCHSTDLQGYLGEIIPEHITYTHGSGAFSEEIEPPDTELLAQLVEQAMTEVAQSIKDVAAKLGSVLDHMPSKYGSMMFQHMRQMNVQRNSIGTYAASIQHEQTPPRLVVLDVSGSMTSTTVAAIADEVVGLAYAVNASLAIVSNSAFLWDAGTFDTDTVLDHAQYGSTRYDQLFPIFDKNDWATVVTIADYDSFRDARDVIAKAKGRIGEIFDISLVNRPTFLAECLGTLATKVTPLMVGASPYPMTA